MESEKMQKYVHIPDDLICYVLRRLPAKSLARFKCVCKSWLSIEAFTLGLPLKSPYSFILVGSCNGFSIWNPWMRRYKTVLETRNFLEVTRLSGFGYDHSTDDYVIVRFIYSILGRQMVEIYSRKYGSWLQMGILLQQIFFCIFGANRQGFSRTELCIGILIVPPDDVVCKKHGFNLCVLGGRLCMINYDHDCHTDIWAWEGNKKGNWIKWMSIPCFEELQSNKYLAPRVLQRLQQQSMTEASEVGVEAKVCRHFLSEIDLHRKSSTPRASLQWTIEQEQCDSQR
ncbi:hypothetical protein ACOSP7_007479 [Xanthoceras sorbifolium]